MDKGAGQCQARALAKPWRASIAMAGTQKSQPPRFQPLSARRHTNHRWQNMPQTQPPTKTAGPDPEVNAEAQPRRDEMAGSDPESVAPQGDKRGQTPTKSRSQSTRKRKRSASEPPSINPNIKRYPLPVTQETVAEALRDLHYSRRKYERHPKASFPHTYRSIAQVFIDALTDQAIQNELPYIYRSPSPEPSDEYETVGATSIPSSPDSCDLFGLTARSPSPEYYHREASLEL